MLQVVSPEWLRRAPERGAACSRTTSGLGHRGMCYDVAMLEQEESDANVQTSASGRPQSRMVPCSRNPRNVDERRAAADCVAAAQVRKMIREIFGHPMAATDCTVYTCRHQGVLAVFHPIGSEPDVTHLGMCDTAREATQKEQGSISFWYTARVRIDHKVAGLTALDGNIDSVPPLHTICDVVWATAAPCVCLSE